MTVAVTRHWRAEDGTTGTSLIVWCPGCDHAHMMRVAGEGAWGWDGSLTEPTVSPSILVSGVKRCHSYLQGGRWRFLADSEHDLAGQEIDMVPLPEWLAAEGEEP